MKKTFELKKEHLKLFQHMWVNWNYGETGAPAINSKRPYGNSLVEIDMLDILEIPYDKDEDLPEDLYDQMTKLHSEMETALQIVLNTLSFEPGMYIQTESYSNKWEKLKGN